MSVGGIEGKKRKKGMQGMSEQCRSGMRKDDCCGVEGIQTPQRRLSSPKHDLSHQPLIWMMTVKDRANTNTPKKTLGSSLCLPSS